MKRLLAALTLLALVTGCGPASPGGPSETGDRQSSVGEFGVFHEPNRLRVFKDGSQLGPWEGVPVVYAQLLRPAQYRHGHGAFPRSVTLWMMIGASGGARLKMSDILVWFEDSDGTETQVPPADCGRRQLPPTIEDGDQVYGCAAFDLPAGSGRLQLRSPDPKQDHFSYFLDVPE